ncbi:MAG: hypothetical protein ABIH99_00725 [Candidatus Micrarchaeota archaeon]
MNIKMQNYFFSKPSCKPKTEKLRAGLLLQYALEHVDGAILLKRAKLAER